MTIQGKRDALYPEYVVPGSQVHPESALPSRTLGEHQQNARSRLLAILAALWLSAPSCGGSCDQGRKACRCAKC